VDLCSLVLYVCFCRFNAAKKDNDFVYHDKVPAFDTLPEIKGLLRPHALQVFECMLSHRPHFVLTTVDLSQHNSKVEEFLMKFS